MAGPEIFRFEHMAALPGIRHGVFTRQGGQSTPPWDALNIGLGCGDDPDIVGENRERMLSALGMERAVFLSQVHGDLVHVIRDKALDPDEIWTAGTGRIQKPVTADAVITDACGLGLVIQTADCQAVVLYDPVRRVIGNVHSGWRGSIADIIGKAVGKMVQGFDCCPADILAGIGPSLGPCCAEFVNYQTEIPKRLWPYKMPDRPYFNFWQLSLDQLTGQGVKTENIRQLSLCTVCRSDLFFSYRKERKTGRFGTVVGLEKNPCANSVEE